MGLSLPVEPSALTRDKKTLSKLRLNLKRNRREDHSSKMDECAEAFRYEDCKDQFWNPDRFSLLYGTPIWEQSDETQRLRLNQLYWVAYYAQIISAEIATIHFNAMSATGLYGLADYREVCDVLDLESSQERAHINVFRVVAEQVEADLFGERVFTRPWRGPFFETMIFPDSNAIKRWYKGVALKFFGQLSSSNAFIASQYLTVRGLRTLNGKMVQQGLSDFYADLPDKAGAPMPAAISHYHYMDESYHFNSSCIIGLDVVRSLPAPTAFERAVTNAAIAGCQRDHANFSVVVNGLFWYEPATFPTVYKVLRGPVFGMSDADAREWMRRSFCEENEGVRLAQAQHEIASASYERFLDPLEFINTKNRTLAIMRKASVERYLKQNKRALSRLKGVA